MNKLQLPKAYWPQSENLSEMAKKNKAAIAKFSKHPYAVPPVRKEAK